MQNKNKGRKGMKSDGTPLKGLIISGGMGLVLGITSLLLFISAAQSPNVSGAIRVFFLYSLGLPLTITSGIFRFLGCTTFGCLAYSMLISLLLYYFMAILAYYVYYKYTQKAK